MNTVNKSASINIYYKTHGLSTGSSVVYNIIGDDGIYYALNSLASLEIDSHGVYYLDFTAPDKNIYLLCKVGLSTGLDSRGIIIRCGDPTAIKLFYVDEKFQGGKTIAYEIFNLVGDVVQNGNLTDEFNSGFYSVDVSLLEDATYFFKVDPYVAKFTIPLQVDQGSAVVTTEIRYVTVNVATSKGGASKTRYTIFDHESEMTKKRIHAKLVTTEKTKGIIVNLNKDEDEFVKDVRAVLVQDGEFDQTFKLINTENEYKSIKIDSE